MDNQSDQVSALKKAMLERAHKLADEHIAQGNASRQKIMQDTREKVQLMEQKELLAARSLAEREYLRKVQASEIQMQAEMDRNRWGMVQLVIEKLKKRLSALVEQNEEYQLVFTQMLNQAAALINQENLIAYVNSQDLKTFQPIWSEISAGIKGSSITLCEESINCSGGVRVLSEDGTVMVDNTFEGLVSREEVALQSLVFERLFASVSGTGVLNHG